MAKKATNAVTHEMIVRDVRAGQVRPVYYLMGEEGYYMTTCPTFWSIACSNRRNVISTSSPFSAQKPTCSRWCMRPWATPWEPKN